MSLSKVFCSWSIAAVLLLLSIAFSNSADSGKSLDALVLDDENGGEGNGTANVTLTGNPQIDYIHDPNLPRELNGYNLSDYPFYSRVPKNINFSCDGRKDGFYASVEHKCQIYHHCLFETRYDFLCANYTAFDQRTFICQFVSDVDCPNSHMFFHRNKDLYVAKSTTTSAPLYIDRDLYARRRPQKKPKTRPRLVGEDDDDDAGSDKAKVQKEQSDKPSSVAPAPDTGSDPVTVAPKRNKGTEYADDDYYEDDYEYPARRPGRPNRRRFRKCRNGRRRGRRCRPRRPPSYYYDDDDYAYDDDYDYAYYDDVRPRKNGKRRRPLNAIPAGTSQVTSTSSSETPPPTTTTTTTTTTELPPLTSSELAVASGPLDSDSVAVLQKQREDLLKPRRTFSNLRPSFRPVRPNENSRSGTTATTTSTTTTERATRPTTTTSTTTTTEIPQYIYDYEYYEDDTAADQASSSTTSTTTTSRPTNFLRGKPRGGNSAAAVVEKQRIQQSVQVKVTEDSGTNTNTIRRRDNSSVLTSRLATPSPTTSTSTTTTATTPISRPARFWQRKSTVKSISTTTAPSTTTTSTTTLAPYYQDYQDYEDVEPDPLPTAPAKPVPPPQSSRQSNRFQTAVNPPQHQYGTSPAAALMQTYASNAPSASPQLQQQSVTSSSRGHGSSLSSSSYASPRPNKHYAMQQPQQYSQSSSSSSSISSNNNNNRDSNSNYNTNSYHRQRSPSPPSPVVPKPEFISLVDEDYNNPYVSGPSGSTSPSSTRLYGGGGGSIGGTLGSPGYHHNNNNQHPIRFFEQHHSPAFLFGSASEYNNPQFAFPPRNYPSPSNFQPYGHSTRRFAPHMYK